MPESKLTLSVTDLKAEIGKYLGYSRGVSFGEPAWDVYQTNDITACLKTGLSQVYTPPPLDDRDPTGASYSWSFLRPFESIVIQPGQSETKLPDWFGGFEGPAYIMTPSTVRNRWTLKFTNEGRVQQQYAIEPTTTGAPRMACEKIIQGTTAQQSTRSMLFVWPIPDAVYTLQATMKHLPDVLTGSYPYPPGGSEHSELFKASCIYAAALQIDDDPGPRRAIFMERLRASVFVDRKRKGIVVGYNRDNSDYKNRANRMPGAYRFYDNNPVLYDGEPLG